MVVIFVWKKHKLLNPYQGDTDRCTKGYYFATRRIKEFKYSNIEGAEPFEEWNIPSFISKGIVDSICK